MYAHGNEGSHHISVLAEIMEYVIDWFQKKGEEAVENIVGARKGGPQQIFTRPGIKNGAVHSVLELIANKNSYQGFPSCADSLMKSIRK